MHILIGLYNYNLYFFFKKKKRIKWEIVPTIVTKGMAIQKSASKSPAPNAIKSFSPQPPTIQ